MKTQSVVSMALLAAGCISRAPAAQMSTSGQAPPGEVWLTPAEVKSAGMEIEPITDRPVGGTIRVAGRVTFDDLRVAHVFSPVTGRITKIIAQPGQRVKKGDKLCVIQSPDLGSAVSDMAKAQAALFQAERDWKRQKELLELHAAPQRDYEAAEGTYLNAKAELERAQHKARLLRSSGLDSATQEYMLPSPIDGEVIMRGANPGLEVQGQYTGGATVELFTIGELDRVWVLADVFEMDLPLVKKGAEVKVTVLSYPEESFPGVVEWISGALDPISRTAKVRCSIDNRAAKLRPEMFGTASIGVDPDTKLAIRRSALLLLGKQTIAFVETGTTSDGRLRFEQRPIAVDELNGGQYVPIRGGVERNEQVVVKGEVLLLGEL
jgi:membrane fusion protein, heavy metal efflux system